MEFQLKLVGQQILKHRVQIVRVVRAVRLGIHGPQVAIEPARAAGDVLHRHPVH